VEGGKLVVREFFDELNIALSGLTTAPFVRASARGLTGLFRPLVGPLLFALEEDADLWES